MATLNRSLSDLVVPHAALVDGLAARVEANLIRTSDRLEAATEGPNPVREAVAASLAEYLPTAVSSLRP